jgi:hypothetical protein
MTDSALAISDGHVFSGIQAFDAAQRMAKALSSSALVPKIYQGQQGLANSLIALELAGRMGISPLTVMQNMTPINGRPSWSSSFLIGTVNACGRFSPLRFIFDDIESPSSCYAEANDIATGEVLRGETITIAMAKAEGWFGRQGSKWQTFPGQMLRYRAGAFWARVYCPEISLGIVTKEEAIDIEQVEVSVSEPQLPVIADDTEAEAISEVASIKLDDLPAGDTEAPAAEPDVSVPAADPTRAADPVAVADPVAPSDPVALKLRERQQLIRTVNALASERKDLLITALKQKFEFNSESPISGQLSTQAHADFINSFISSQ